MMGGPGSGRGDFGKRSCEWCGGLFIAPQRRSRYCSENCRKNAAADRKRGECVDCGRLLSAGSAWREQYRCIPCEHEHRRVRYPEIRERWLRGESITEIAEALDTTANAIGVAMVNMRRTGWDLPYRYAMHDGKRIAA